MLAAAAPAPPPAPPAGPPGHCPRSLAAPPAAGRMLVALLPILHSVLRRCRVPARDIPDLAHNLLIKLLPWAARLPSEDLVAPFDHCRRYACAAAARCAWGYKRREARRGELLGWEPRGAESTGEPPAPDLSPEEMLLEREAAADRAAELDLDRLRQATTPACWRAFHAHRVDGTPVALIAEVEQLPVATVYNRIRIARRDLRAAILRRRAGAHRK